QDRVFNYLYSTNTMSKLSVQEAMYGEKAYGLIEYFNDIDESMWTELREERPIDIYRRNLQRSYVEALIKLSEKNGREYRDAAPIAKNKLTEIHTLIRKSKRKVDDPIS